MKEFIEIGLMFIPLVVTIFQIGERLGRLEALVNVLDKDIQALEKYN